MSVEAPIVEAPLVETPFVEVPVFGRPVTGPRRLRERIAGWPYLGVVLALGLAGCAALDVDLPLAHWTLRGGCPKFLHDLLQRGCEAFGYGGTVALILVAVHVLDPLHRWAVPRLVLMTYGSGGAAQLLKLFLARMRPRPFTAAFPLDGDVWHTFHGWFQFGSGGYNLHSFPSGHSATAAGLAAGLMAIYPRGRWLFLLFAMLAFSQRIESGAHFLSDVMWGAAIGWLVGVGLSRVSLSWIGLDRWEDAIWKRAARDAADRATR